MAPTNMDKPIDDPGEAEHGCQVTLETLESLQKLGIGPNGHKESSLSGIRLQIIYNLVALMNAEFPALRAPATDSLSVGLSDPAERAVFADDSIMQEAFALMDAFDRRDWIACVAVLKAMREPLLTKFRTNDD